MNATTRPRFYETLATAIEAGLPPAQALRTSAPDDLAEVADALMAGQSLAAAFRRFGGAPPSDIAIVEVGERSGRLPAALRRLGARYARKAAFQRRLIGRLAYPILLLHAAVLLPALPLVVSQGLTRYLSATGSMLLMLYGVGFALSLAWRFLPLEGLVLRWPIIGPLLRSRAVADHAFVFGALLSAGAPLPESLKTAAQSVDLQALRAAGLRVAMAVRSGRSLADAMADETAIFGKVTIELVHTGEVAGKLETMLEQVETMAERDADQASRLIVKALSALALFVAAVVIASMVIGFWSGYAQRHAIARLFLIQAAIPGVAAISLRGRRSHAHRKL